MNEAYTLIWSAIGALLPIIIATIAITNHFSNRFEALGDRIDRVAADLDKLFVLENERRQTQLYAEAAYREKIEYLINDNRNRADHHRSALEKQIAAGSTVVDRQIEELSGEMKHFRGYLTKNSDYVDRQQDRSGSG